MPRAVRVPVPGDVAACSHCGSVRVQPKIWVQGFLPTINDERQTYVCRDCGKEGILVRFASEEARAAYAEEARTGVHARDPPRPAADAIPILPLDAVPLLEVRGIDAIPIYRSKVVDARWSDGRLHRGGYRVDVATYWDAVGGSRYNAGRVYVLDLAGINHGKPNFEALRGIGKRTSMLLDIGARSAEDVMDGLMVDVEAVVVGTKNLRSVDQFREIREISEGVVPCLDVAGGVVWSDRSKEDSDLGVVARALSEAGFGSLAVMDLSRLGTFAGPDRQLVSRLEGLEFELMLGGGVREEDAAGLRERGIAHALVDPFTPVIRALLPTEEKPAPAEAIPVEKPSKDVRGTPAPG
ncbi:MAG TPA: HisA/HisF-related TIM barrel protein [Thermoplasmata archaeon]|nr:HisA/HisF-related TIM barrel protein [Thermoplasmata archaeon]